MKQVGIITYHHVHNFGAVLQAWSLVQTVRRLGCEVDVIDYRPPGAERRRGRGVGRWLPSPGRWRMRRFMHRRLPLTPTLSSQQEVAAYVANRKRYDCLICGSDQVWMKDDRRGFDRTYYLDVANPSATRLISYAPSCGSMESYGEHGEEVGRLLSRFHAVSARDQNTLRIVRSLGVKDVTHVVDPTLLADFGPLTAAAPRRRGDYIAVTGPMDAAAGEFVRELSVRLKAPAVAVGTRCPGGAVEERRFADPAEWASYMAHARFVVTSLFHGAALSMRFRQPFVALDSGGRGFKLSDLLGRFGLEDRLVTRGADGRYGQREELMEMDYGRAEATMAAQADSSLTYLREALNG